ncbi:MAG: sigma 54-interacting transcriptional regulator, partial [Planctomycetes bacterium]|nr:sigma 54-interacting transcriptional regulator [Planctomycetota bacterium]
DETDFNDQDLKILQVFATLAAGATQNARTHHELKQRFAGLRDSVMKRKEILGDSAVWRNTITLCDRVSRSGATVLLLGETGTGKELIARYIHNTSPRHDAAFVAVNCAALTETLLESELFGHEKGSFTGAHAQRRGWFEVANGGTLFLDEIGEISRAMQAKLLRVLQEKRFVRVGGTKSVSCDTRVIAATNRHLKHLMIDGMFREDLYYRISVFPISLPSLRERREDIPIFVDAFVKTSASDCNIAALGVAADTMDLFLSYHWPGNIRELQNVIERSVLMSDGDTLLPEHLPADILETAHIEESDQPSSELSRHEKQMIVNSLEHHGWNQSKAARALGITRYHMRHRIKKYAIRKPSNIVEAD